MFALFCATCQTIDRFEDATVMNDIVQERHLNHIGMGFSGVGPESLVPQFLFWYERTTGRPFTMYQGLPLFEEWFSSEDTEAYG